MCMFGGGGNTTPPDPPIRYQQQTTPTRVDTRPAQERAASSRLKATRTLLTTPSKANTSGSRKTLLAATTEADETGKKTLLGAM